MGSRLGDFSSEYAAITAAEGQMALANLAKSKNSDRSFRNNFGNFTSVDKARNYLPVILIFAFYFLLAILIIVFSNYGFLV